MKLSQLSHFEIRPRFPASCGEFGNEEFQTLLKNPSPTRVEWVRAAHYIQLNPQLAASLLETIEQYEQALYQLKITRGDQASAAFELFLTLPSLVHIRQEAMQNIYYAGENFSADLLHATRAEFFTRTALFQTAVPYANPITFGRPHQEDCCAIL